MTTRSGMTDLITTLRGMTDAGPDDYTIGLVTYWSDDQLQAVQDRHHKDYWQAPFSPMGSVNGGTVQYYRYETSIPNQESGTAVFKVQDVLGAEYAGTLYSVDYTQGIVTWTTNTLGSAIYLSGRTYDLNASAAEVWRHKAVNVAKAYDFSTDNHKLNRSQMFAQFMQMASFYAQQAGPTSVEIMRGDMNACREDD